MKSVGLIEGVVLILLRERGAGCGIDGCCVPVSSSAPDNISAMTKRSSSRNR